MMKISFVWITCPAQMLTSVILHDESRLQVAAEEGVRCFQIKQVVNVKEVSLVRQLCLLRLNSKDHHPSGRDPPFQWLDIML